LTWALTPKSLRKTSPARSMRMLPALMSLWIWLYEWKYCRASQTCYRMVAMSSSSFNPSLKLIFITSETEPAPSRGITSQRSDSSVNDT